MKKDVRGAVAYLVALERAELAQGEELHGSLCQTLAGTTFLAEVLVQNKMVGKNIDLRDLRKIKASLAFATKEMQFLMLPSVLQSEGLLPALSQLASRVSLRTPCQFQSSIDHLNIDERKSRVLYRLVKSALLFLVRGDGGKITILLKATRNGSFQLNISRKLRTVGSLQWNKSDLLIARNCALALNIDLEITDPPQASYNAVFQPDF